MRLLYFNGKKKASSLKKVVVMISWVVDYKLLLEMERL